MNAPLQVPLLDLKAQYVTIQSEIRAAIDRVCQSQQFILGPEVAALEEEVAQLCGSRFAVGVSSGTDALLVALMALEVGLGDEVVTTPYSFFATAGVVARLGARPVFVDIDPKTFNIDTRAVSAKLNARTKAIIPVHLYGQCVDLTQLRLLTQERNIPIIEDAAQAISATDEHHNQAGTTGAMGCFSFFPSKNLGAFGDAGMVVTSDEQLADQLRTLRIHGGKSKYYHAVIGGNFRLDALQAAVLRVKLPYLETWTSRRRENAHRYRSLIAQNRQDGFLDWVTLPQDSSGHIYNQFNIRVPHRDQLREFLKGRGIGTEIYYPLPLHLQECFQQLGYQRGDFPHAEAASRESLALPIYPELTEEQQGHVVDVLKEWEPTH